MDDQEIESIAARVLSVLGARRFTLGRESDTQDEIAAALTEAGIPFLREYALDAQNRPDFLVGGLAIEVKIKGSAMAIYRQCERYTAFPAVRAILLATNRAMGMPKELGGKPCYYLNLGLTWL